MQWEVSRKKCRGPEGDGKSVAHCTWEEKNGLPVLTEIPAMCALVASVEVRKPPNLEGNLLQPQ